ncbi:MAG: thermonuclease family protein [Gammaproteobacteria bacterium]|nr:thermonuclease family protein [Gammaproteobacteria bacterium]
MHIQKRTLQLGVLFCVWLLSTHASANCPAFQIHETATVKSVHDGDTIRLNDGRKVRLIGIDTPELARNNKPSQAYAIEARNALSKLLKQHDNHIGLSYGTERFDKYRRTLAHLFLPDGNNVQDFLLRNGYATAYTTPPNDHMADCYRRSEATAIKQRQGIWSLNQYQIKLPEQLKTSEQGFRRIQGKIQSVQPGKQAWWINMPLNNRPGMIKIRIAKKDLQHFDLHSLRLLPNKTARIRGWLHPNKTGFFINLRHPSALLADPK